MTKKPDCYKQKKNDFLAGKYCVEAQTKIIYHWSVWLDSIIRENPREKNDIHEGNLTPNHKRKQRAMTAQSNQTDYPMYCMYKNVCMQRYTSQLSFF